MILNNYRCKCYILVIFIYKKMSCLIKTSSTIVRRSSNIIYYSTQAVTKIKEETITNELMKKFEKISQITPKYRTKKPKKPPFAKNLFLGVFDTDILTYPQIEKDELEQLDKNVTPIEKYFTSNDLNNYQSNKIPVEFLENFKKLQLFGLKSPQILGGREFNITECTRINEVIGNATSLFPMFLYNDQLGIELIQKHGNEHLQNKFLPDLISGYIMSAFCFSEGDIFDSLNMKTTAVLSNDKKSWILNGEKSYVVNGSNADILIVLAQTDIVHRDELKGVKTTAFLVEKNCGGITYEYCNPMGINQIGMNHIKFENTKVPIENVIGKVNESESIINFITPELRVGVGPPCVTITKLALNNLHEHCKELCNLKPFLINTEFVRSKISKIAVDLYAVESALYLTTGLLDQYEDQDCELEAAIVKVFSSEIAHISTLECMNFIGTASYMNDHLINILHRNALSYVLLNETNDNLKIIIALLGLQHSGKALNEVIKKARNPLFHPAAALKRMWIQRKHMEDSPTLNLGLGNYLHPSLIVDSQRLEYCVLRLQYATETILARYGSDVINKHMELQRLAECVIDIYAMTASLGRASRSYCIGLANADYEILLASSFCADAMERIKANISKISIGPYGTNDENYNRIGEKFIQCKKYFAVHPLSRNF